MLTGLTLWGSGRPVFRLPTGRALRGIAEADGAGARDRSEKLPGSFALTQTIADVTATTSMDDYLTPGDRVSMDRSKWYKILAVSGVNVDISPAYAEASAPASPLWVDRSRVVMPYVTDNGTRIRFDPERYDGGPIVIRLSDGSLVRRAQGFRCTVELSWRALGLAEMKRMVMVHNEAISRSIILQPHSDINWEFEVVDLTTVEMRPTDGKLVGHDHTAVFQSATLMTEIPVVHAQLAGAGFAPAVF